MTVNNSLSFFPKLCLISISIHLFAIHFLVEGFSTELFHRDHPKITGQESSKSPYERLHGAFRRSLAAKESIKAQFKGSGSSATNNASSGGGGGGEIESSIGYIFGEYLMELSIGTPPFTFMGLVHTASDLTWTQTEACEKCNNPNVAIFDPAKSSSYKKVPFGSPLCDEIELFQINNASNNCAYKIPYSNVVSVGDLSTETFTFRTKSGKNVSFPDITFGCQRYGVNDNVGYIGVGRGNLSLLTQLDNYTNGKFSYCLIPFGQEVESTSRISFGSSAVVVGNDTKTTPLYKGNEENIFYFLKLEGISVVPPVKGNPIMINYSTTTPLNTGKGNIIMGTHSALTYLPSQMVTKLREILRKFISGTIVPDPKGFGNICYKAGEGTVFPDIVAHFTGADIVLPKSNTFLQFSEDTICLMILASDELPVFGNLSQGDYHIGYDLVNNTVSFQQTDCTKVV